MSMGTAGDAGDASLSTPPTYSSGERVFGPPIGSFDVEWVARQIERETPASFAQAHRSVVVAWQQARGSGSLDSEELTAAARSVGASAAVADAVAVHVAAYCAAYEVDPAAR